MEYTNIAFEIEKKDISDDGIFKGYGSTFGGKPDSYGDIINEGAFSDSLKKGGRNGFGVAMLYQHQSDKPIGVWTVLQEDKKGLYVEGKLAMEVQQAREAHALMKLGALRGLSIGYDFKGIPSDEAVSFDDKKKLRYIKKLNLWEISPVTFPANTSARITGIKMLEEARNIREFEEVLRDLGLTHRQSLYIASLCKGNLQKGNIKLDQLLQEIKNCSDIKGAIPFKSFSKAPENTPWDGPGETAKADVKQLKIMCTWYDSANSELKSAYKLPHHKAGSYTTIWNGVKAAMGALLGARGGTILPAGDKRGVYNHLAKHYREFDKEPPEFK